MENTTENTKPMFAPQAIGVNQISVVATATDIAVFMGQNRHLLNPGNGQPRGMAIEWISAYSISPTAAMNLKNSLVKAIEIYEQRFGKIPLDPASRIEISDQKAKG